MRVALFASGSPASIAALDALPDVSAVILPRGGGSRQLQQRASSRGVATRELDPGNERDLVSFLRETARPDLICVATFPWILNREIFEAAPAGALNVHHSLLPKHRGPDPLFWTYMCDDRETGVTVHWIDERVDSGDIVLQKRIALERGRPLVDLYYDLATLGAELLRDAVAMIERGTAPRIPQDEAAATDDPARGKKTWHVDLARWPSERVWHVVRGVTIGTESVLSDSDGRPIAHGPARTYTVTSHARTAGTIESLGSGWRIYCVDGFVDVDPPARRPRTSQRIKKFIRSLLQRPS